MLNEVKHLGRRDMVVNGAEMLRKLSMTPAFWQGVSCDKNMGEVEQNG